MTMAELPFSPLFSGSPVEATGESRGEPYAIYGNAVFLFEAPEPVYSWINAMHTCEEILLEMEDEDLE